MTTVAMPVVGKIVADSKKSAEFTEYSAQFGDGYSQHIPAGLNAKRDVWDVVWSGLTQAEMTTVEAALDSVGTWGIITWTPCNESVQKKFRMQPTGYARERLGKGGFKITAKLKQEFDL